MTKKTSTIAITNFSIMATGLALSLGLAACQNAPKNENLPKLNELSAKIDALSRKIDSMAVQAAGQARPVAQAPKRPTVGQLYKVAVGQEDAYRGGKDAKVTLVMASEFACPYCAQLAGEADKLLENFADDELRVVSKHFIVHPSLATKPAHAVCAAAQQGQFEKFEQALWQEAWYAEGAGKLNQGALAQEGLDAIARDLGLDLPRFHRDMAGTCTKTVAQNHQEMAALGVNGTPAVYINGAYYGGARSFEALQAAISAEITRVDAAIAKGAPRAGYYDTLIAKGKETI